MIKLSRFRRGGDDFLPSVTTLVSGSTLAMSISYLARPILTRLYTPEMFGILGVFTALVAVLTTVSSGRYDDAVMLPEEDEKARTVFALGLSILSALALLTTPIAMFRNAVANSIGKPELAPYLVVLPVSLFSMGLVRLAESWMSRERKFRIVAAGRAAQSATAVPIQLAAGFRHVGPWGLIGGLVSGQAAAAAILGVLSWRRLRHHAWPGLSELRKVAERFRDFPFFSGPSALLNSFSSQLPAFLLFFYFDARVVGHYAQAYALLAVPIGLMGSSVAQVFFVNAARCRVEGGLDALTERVYRRLLEIGLFPMLVVLVAGPDLLEFVLGKDWTTAGVYAQWLAIWLLFVFVASPLTRLFDVLERLRANLVFNVSLFSMRAAVLVIGGSTGEPIVAIALYGVVSALLYLVMLGWLLKMGGVRLMGAALFFARALAIAALPVLAVAAAAVYFQSPSVIFLTTCLAGLVYALAVLVPNGNRDRS